ncbi:HSF-type DNA-binding-domain-containing protein [Lipomyces arxii]|uniref:HSF-type DNA-binding-domain-containing protein n=1 Tax=Lipomyces arxii TaxID=56418 RepID=UPI0034CF2773
MLEDSCIQHLISWTPTNDSFVVSPNEEFSKVLSQYFKHTNVSSFVRQLNMYGFHKVNDVFHAGSTPETGQWEFKHGENNFKRGDVEALRGIRRRASRQSVAHRDSTSSKSGSVSLPITPISPNGSLLTNSYVSEPPMHGIVSATPTTTLPNTDAPQHAVVISAESTDAMRLANLESTMWRLQDSQLRLQSRSDMVVESVRSCQDWIRSLISIVSRMPLGTELTSVEAELRHLHDEISRRAQLLSDEPQAYANLPQVTDDRRNSMFKPPYPAQENVVPPSVTSVPQYLLGQPYGLNPPMMRRPGSYPSPSHALPRQNPAIRRHASSEVIAGGDPRSRSWSDMSTSTDSSGGALGAVAGAATGGGAGAGAGGPGGTRRSLPGTFYSHEHAFVVDQRRPQPTSQATSPLSPSSISLSPLHQPGSGLANMRRESVNPAVQFSSVNQHYRIHPESPNLAPTSGRTSYSPFPTSGSVGPTSMPQKSQQPAAIPSPTLQVRPQPRPHQIPPLTPSAVPRQSSGVGVHSLLNPLDKTEAVDTESPPLSPLSMGRKRKKE